MEELSKLKQTHSEEKENICQKYDSKIEKLLENKNKMLSL